MLLGPERGRDVECLAQVYMAAKSGGRDLRLGLSESAGHVFHLDLYLSKTQIPGPRPRTTESCPPGKWPGTLHVTRSPGDPCTCRWLGTTVVSDGQLIAPALASRGGQ